MIPSRLIVLRRYTRREFAEADRDQLIEAGIPAYVKRVMADSARSLMVGEEHVDAALALLGESDHGTWRNRSSMTPCTCIRCLSGATLPASSLTFAALRGCGALRPGLRAGGCLRTLGRDHPFERSREEPALEMSNLRACLRAARQWRRPLITQNTFAAGIGHQRTCTFATMYFFGTKPQRRLSELLLRWSLMTFARPGGTRFRPPVFEGYGYAGRKVLCGGVHLRNRPLHDPQASNLPRRSRV